MKSSAIDDHYYLNTLGIICAAGDNKHSVLNRLLDADQAALSPARVISELPAIPSHLSRYNTRTNRLLLAAWDQISDVGQMAIQRYGAQRVAVIIGTSTSGIAEGEVAVQQQLQRGAFPAEFAYKQQELASTAEFVSAISTAEGPSFATSTSCSSAASAICSAQRLLHRGLCDAVICGGADALCETTIQGFAALGAVSHTGCNPFSRNRDGILIGEGAALFVMSRDSQLSVENNQPVIELLGTGNSSDAYHISAPQPHGTGAIKAMQLALDTANLSADQIDYINLHGTGTPHNDAMESRAVHHLFADHTACSSTKPLTGHCLGAAAAIELGLCYLLLSDLNPDKQLPVHCWDEQADTDLPKLCFTIKTQTLPQLSKLMSNTYSFGGNNVSLIIGRRQ